MCSLDSAEMTDLIGLYILYNLTKDIEVDTSSIYIDNDLLFLKNADDPMCDRIEKNYKNSRELTLKLKLPQILK